MYENLKNLIMSWVINLFELNFIQINESFMDRLAHKFLKFELLYDILLKIE